MRVVLIGADNEENLGMAMIAASLSAAHHQVKVVPFTDFEELSTAVDLALGHRPQLIGLAMQFQHRGWEFTALADRLRQAGFRGHLTAGGQFATMAHEPLLKDTESLDSVVLYDGEETIVELAEAIDQRQPIATVAGIAVRLDDGCIRRTEARQIPQHLDALPLAQRYRPASRHFGVPFIPMSGGRGCWGSCAFCSITSFYRGARKATGGLGFRLRTPGAIAAEMAELTRREQSPCIFCFHDETLLLPRPADTKLRLGELTQELQRLSVEGYGLVGKCRPDCLTAELAQELAANKVIRLYVGIENASQAGQDHLSRHTRTEQLDRALCAINDANIFGCYNLLIFEPKTTFGDIRENIEFIRNHPINPVNFCRAEPYHGTPLWEQLQKSGKLEGSWLGWDYHLDDPLVETLFRLTAVVFRQRNFDCYGVANRSMSLGYMAKILRHFHGTNPSRVATFEERARELTRQITSDTADLLEEALKLVERFGTTERDALERETALLGLRVAERDGKLHTLIDQFVDDTEAYVTELQCDRRMALPGRLYDAFTGLALAGCLAAANPGCGGGMTADPVPPTGGRTSAPGGFGGVDPVPSTGGRTSASGGYGGMLSYDALPPSGGRTGIVNTASGGMIVDPVPPTGGRTSAPGGFGGVDPVPPTGGRTSATGGYGGMLSYDALPPSGGRTSTTSTTSGGTTSSTTTAAGGKGGGMTFDGLPPAGGRTSSTSSPSGGTKPSTTTATGGFGGMIADPLPPTGGRTSTSSSSTSSGGTTATTTTASGGLSASLESSDEMRVGHFRDTRTRRTVRNSDLPLFDPPEVVLESKRAKNGFEVSVVGLSEDASARWQSRGKIEGAGLVVQWLPEDPDDQLRVAVRTPGGVTIAALRVKDIPQPG